MLNGEVLRGAMGLLAAALLCPGAIAAEASPEVAALKERLELLERDVSGSLDGLAREIEAYVAAHPGEASYFGPARSLLRRVDKFQTATERHIPWGWYAFGLLAQAAFFGRFLVQWLASERARQSVVPVSFWYLSIVGSLMLLTYAAVFLRDPIIIIGQTTGFFIYVRNLVLLGRKRRRAEPVT